MVTKQRDFLFKKAALGVLALALAACNGSTVPVASDASERTDTADAGMATEDCLAPDGVERPSNWTDETHCRSAETGYDFVFDDSEVRELVISMPASTYEGMLDDLDNLFAGGPQPSDQEPMWAEVSIQYEGFEWQHVGMRFKGNSSLQGTLHQGSRKFPFRLSFDQYEDEYPEIDDQRFYGFRKMTFSNMMGDPSLIRERLAWEVFKNAGVPAAHAVFVRVMLDVGDGPTYAGLYTMIEDPSDQLLDHQFESDSGNLYKPEGPSVWAMFREEHFEKKTNEDEADFTDVIEAIDALNADRSDAAAWRARWESSFETTIFLRAVAVNQTISNWDAHGVGTHDHNYYVYGDPGNNGVLTWIPWDLNEAFRVNSIGGTHDAGTIMLDEASATLWPTVRFMLDDSVYRAAYVQELSNLLSGAFEPIALKARIEELHAQITPYVVGEEGESQPYTLLGNPADFEGALTGGSEPLLSLIDDRVAAVEDALAAEAAR